MSNETDLNWLARNVHVWSDGMREVLVCYPRNVDALIWSCVSSSAGWITKEQWLARRAELQNKPSWADAPEWAQWLGQIESGNWEWYGGEEAPSAHESGDCWLHKAGGKPSGVGGEVLGDWRDTLERRPVDLSEPAGGVKERGADGAEEINAMAQRLLVALKSEPRSFDTGALAEMVELADAEIVKRDAKVCGGEGYLNNHWFERGELPPVGTRCEALITSENQWVEIEVICHRDGFALGWCLKERCGYHGDEPTDFRPIRTERDDLVDVLTKAGISSYAHLVADAILAAGYRKESK